MEVAGETRIIATTSLMSGVVLPTQKRVQRAIIREASEPYRTVYGLAAETGLRAGELCGLTLDDLDFERRLLFVRQSAWRGRVGDPKRGYCSAESHTSSGELVAAVGVSTVRKNQEPPFRNYLACSVWM